MQTILKIKNLHKKLLSSGVLISPLTKKSDPALVFNDFNYKNISFLNYHKYSLQFYEILKFLQLVKKLNLNVIYIYGTQTNLAEKFQLFGRILNTNYFTGNWINGFFTNSLFLSKRNLLVKKNNAKFFCPKKPQVAIVFWSTNVQTILKELHDCGIITILIGHNTPNNNTPSFYLPGGNLSPKNYLFYFLFFINIFSPQTKFTKIDSISTGNLTPIKC